MNVDMNVDRKSKLKFIFFALLFFAFFGTAEISSAADHYVREGASGANNGSDWTNAWSVLPAALTRGDTYYIADGTYPGYVFDDEEDGSLYITVKKATASDHGTNIGWHNSFGDGVSDWLVNVSAGTYNVGWVFLDDYYNIDGVTGGGPNSWTLGHGFKMSSPNETDIFVMLSDKFGIWGARPDVSNIIISHIEIDGQFATPGYGIGIQANAFSTTVTNITLAYLYIHDISGFVDFRANPSGIIVQYSAFVRNATSPEHHGVGIRLDYLSGPFVYRYNSMSDIVGTGWIGHYCGNVDDGDGAEFYGNVFYSTDSQTEMTGLGIIFSDSCAGVPVVDDWKIYNNTFYGFPVHGKIVELDTVDSSNVKAYNNLIYDLDGPITFTNVDDQQNNTSALADPFFSLATYDFRLGGAVASGLAIPSPYNVDMMNSIRGSDGAWDIGAFEYVSGAPSDTTAPAAPSGLTVD